MVVRIDRKEFIHEFEMYQEVGDFGSFSYEGVIRLYERLMKLEEKFGELVLDVKAICETYEEYDSMEALHDADYVDDDILIYRTQYTVIIVVKKGKSEEALWENKKKN